MLQKINLDNTLHSLETHQALLPNYVRNIRYIFLHQGDIDHIKAAYIGY